MVMSSNQNLSELSINTRALNPPSPHHHHPSPTLRSNLAETLPPHILVDIFLEVVRLQEHEDSESGETIDEPMNGGRLFGWDNNASIRYLALVCRSWEDSANLVLYRSIALFGVASAELFLRTAQQRPDLPPRTTALVLGLGKNRESLPKEEEAHLVESFKVLEVLGVCVNVRRLQLQPLHRETRPTLMAALLPLELVSFTYEAAYQGLNWRRGLILPDDLPVFLQKPTLRELEIDLATGIDFTATPPSLFLPLPQTSLSSLRLQTNYPLVVTLAVVSSCFTTLQQLELYLEAPIPHQPMIAALLPSAPTLRSLSIIINPSTMHKVADPPPTRPLIDQILPVFTNLEILRVSAPEVSVAALHLLPQSLRHMCVYAFGTKPFTPPEVILQEIHKMPPESSLEVLCIHDDLENWDDMAVNEVLFSLRERDIEFALSDSVYCSDSII